MKSKYGPTPIPIPPIIDDERYIGRFSRAVRKSICALRDRNVFVAGGGGGGGRDSNQFAKRSMKTDPEAEGAYLISFNPGYVKDIITQTATEVAVMHMPEIDGVPLDDTPAPQLSVSIGDSVYVQYSTTTKGVVSGDPIPTLMVSATEPEGAHYQPDDDTGSGGTEGSYYIKIGTLEEIPDSDPVRGKWVPFQNSDIEHYHELWSGENIGAGAGVWKRRDPDGDTYEFRSIDGNYGITETENADAVQLDFNGANLGGAVTVYQPPATPEAPDAGPANFRTLRGLNYTEETAEGIAQQIQVDAAPAEDGTGIGQCVLIRGNSKNGSRTITVDGGTAQEVVTWEDGLVTSEGDADIAIDTASGDDFNLRHYKQNGSNYYDNDWTIYFRGGLAFLTDDLATVTELDIYECLTCPDVGP
jgi:hypothetical protein